MDDTPGTTEPLTPTLDRYRRRQRNRVKRKNRSHR